MNRLVIYHRNCADGFGAAMAAKKHQEWADAEYVAAQYGEEPPDVKGKHVLIMDFSYPRDVLEKMNESALSLFVIDHHKTAEKELEGLDYAIFDMSQSGAMMAWKILHPEDGAMSCVNELLSQDDRVVPVLIQYVQDRDLWKWKLANSREVSAALASYPMDFEMWNELLNDNEMPRLALEGEAILRYQTREVSRAIGAWKRNPQHKEIGGHRVPVMNCTSLISEICGELSDGYPFAATYMDVDGKRIYSLRTRQNDFDCGAVAREYGGGGHPGAAGYAVTL